MELFWQLAETLAVAGAALPYHKLLVLVGKVVISHLAISGDSDFVPAAKLARREGIDFILDPMQANVEPQLFEHVDGITSLGPFFNRKK